MITQIGQIERTLSKITNPSQHTATGSLRHASMSQSQFTRNRLLTQSFPEAQFSQLNNEIIEIYNEYEKNYNTILEIDKIDIKTETKKKPQIKTIIVQPKKKLVQTFDGLKQSDLEIEYINRIQIVRFRFYYFRVRIKGKLTPLQIFLNFPSKIQSTQYKLFVSTTIEFPNKFNADQTVQSRFVKIHSKYNSKLFYDEYVYLTFYCEFDAIIGMQVLFGEQYTQSHPHKEIQSMIEFDTIYERRTFHPRDKILQNIEFAKGKSSSKLEEMLKSKHRSTKSQEIIKRSRCIQQEKRESRLIKLLVKDQIAQFRDTEKTLQKERQLMIHIQKSWIRIISVFDLSEKLFKKLEEVRKKNQVAAKAKLLVWQLHTKMLIEVRRYGENPLIRSLSKTSLVLNTFTLSIRDKCTDRAESIVSKFLVEIILYQTVINKHASVVAKIKCIQRNYRKLRLIRKNFKDKFIKAFKEKIQNLYQGRGGDSKPRITLEQSILHRIFEEYTNRLKHHWIDSRRQLNVLTMLKKSFSVQRKDIKLYQLPDDSEMQQIIQYYYKLKKQMN